MPKDPIFEKEFLIPLSPIKITLSNLHKKWPTWRIASLGESQFVKNTPQNKGELDYFTETLEEIMDEIDDYLKNKEKFEFEPEDNKPDYNIDFTTLFYSGKKGRGYQIDCTQEKLIISITDQTFKVLATLHFHILDDDERKALSLLVEEVLQYITIHQMNSMNLRI